MESVESSTGFSHETVEGITLSVNQPDARSREEEERETGPHLNKDAQSRTVNLSSTSPSGTSGSPSGSSQY